MSSDDSIQRYLRGEATDSEVKALEASLAKDAGLRKKFIREAVIDAGLREIALEHVAEQPSPVTLDSPTRPSFSKCAPIAVAASLAFLLGLSLVFLKDSTEPGESIANEAKTTPSAEGYAVVSNLQDAVWFPNEPALKKGDNLGAETLRLQSGVAEIQFFSGATMVVQGPAEIALTSAWEAQCREGSVRMQVPPAGRGFRLHGPMTEIVDLGTEFGFEVRDGQAKVEVIDGEISLRHRQGDEQLVETGGAWHLPNDGTPVATASDHLSFPNRLGFDQMGLREDFERWKTYSRAFAQDDRVIAYYTFDNPGSVVPSLAEPRSAEFNGAIVLAETASGRWPGLNQALEFRRPGSRVRVRIPGEFEALTFAAWVRIDSLDRRYNALFMGDGYETGEPHWQIRDDGRLMLSVMVDGSKAHPKHPDVKFHHVYFSPPLWDLSMSGQWMHLTSVYDPIAKQVSHYVNGERISRETIAPEFVASPLRIGNGEIGNWGQPFRETPWFAIRNLNGRLDDLAILGSALSDDEIRELYSQSQTRLN